MHLAQQGWREHRGLSHMRELLTNWLPQGGSPDLRGWEWFYLNALPYQNLSTLLTSGSKARPACTVAWHAASRRLASGSGDGVIRIWDVDRERTTLTLTGPGQSSGPWWATRWFAWSPDGGELAAGFVDGTVHFWETRTGRELRVFRGHAFQIIAVFYSSDGLRLASWDGDGTIKIRDAATGRLVAEVHHPAGVCAGVWSPDEKRLATGHTDGTVTISDARAGGKVATLRGHVDLIYDLAWSPDGARLASAGGDFTARIWEVASEKMVVGPLRHSHGITSVAWEPGGRRLATGSIDQSVKIWDATTGREDLILRGHVHSVTSLAWSPDGRLASGGGDGSVRIHRSISDQESNILPGHTARATAAAWSPDGRSAGIGRRRREGPHLGPRHPTGGPDPQGARRSSLDAIRADPRAGVETGRPTAGLRRPGWHGQDLGSRERPRTLRPARRPRPGLVGGVEPGRDANGRRLTRRDDSCSRRTRAHPEGPPIPCPQRSCSRRGLESPGGSPGERGGGRARDAVGLDSSAGSSPGRKRAEGSWIWHGAPTGIGWQRPARTAS